MVILQGIFPKNSILYFRSSAFANLLLNKNDTSLPFALTPLNSRDNSYNKVRYIHKAKNGGEIQ